MDGPRVVGPGICAPGQGEDQHVRVGAARLEAEILDIVTRLGLEPHPEGGFLRETFRSAEGVETSRGWRSLQTVALYLMVSYEPSRLHRVHSREHWFHVAGAPVEHFTVHLRGSVDRVVIGAGGQVTPAYAEAPPLCFQAARVLPPGRWSLIACVVSPGFEYADFELASKEYVARLRASAEGLPAGLLELMPQCERSPVR